MRAFAGLLLFAIAACTQTPPPAASAIRDMSVLMTSTTRFDVSQFQGTWHSHAQIAGPNLPSSFDVEVGPGSVVKLAELHSACDASGHCEAWGDEGKGGVTGPGRMTLTYVGGAQKELWVLWVDPDYRTAALTDRQGSFAWIVDRKTRGGSDRIKAAREVLDFNGFDLTQLRPFRR